MRIDPMWPKKKGEKLPAQKASGLYETR